MLRRQVLYSVERVLNACNRMPQLRSLAAHPSPHYRSVHGLTPDVVCYMHAIAACGAAGAHDWALVLLGDMAESGVQPDVWVYNAAIAACAKAR